MPAPGGPEPVSTALEAIRAKFVASLPDRILYFEAAKAASARDGEHELALRAIDHAAHKLAGLAPSLGFAAIGELAREIETAIEREAAGGEAEAVLQRIEPRLETLLDRLEDILD